MTELEFRYATEFLVPIKWNDEDDYRSILITRHDNHGGWIPDQGWAACIVFSSLNPWYLSEDGIWRYKVGDSFLTAKITYEKVKKSRSPSESVEISKEVKND